MLADRLESTADEEAGLESQAEQPRQAQLPGSQLEAFDDRTPDAVIQMVVAHEQGAHLSEVLPHDVQGPASDQFARHLGDDELLHRAVQHRQILAEQDTSLDQRLQKRMDAGDVGGAGCADGVLGHRSRLGLVGGGSSADSPFRSVTAGSTVRV
ncbi:hypothetical protein GCM10025863_30900 [Microbacterium suwonense]|uniref:Uncharacterized protein n=1 Tax=Microbacterium suwonense TaxID=683047 RepID=A0ABN6X6Z3_9MICO|nr:hypothetical protein GCM10025863_30900 [Microbacterium suwonense]